MQISISKKDLKIAEQLTKIYFFFYFRDRAIKGEGNKQRRHRKYMRKSKTCILIMDCFDYILISTNDLAYLIPVPMFSLVS